MCKGMADDDDSMSAGSEIDFEYWDSESEQLDGFEFPMNSMEKSVTKSVSGNIETEGDDEKEIKEKKEETKVKKSSKTKKTSRTAKKQMKLMHARSASVGFEDDNEVNKATTYVMFIYIYPCTLLKYVRLHDRNRGIFSDTAKVFRLQYSHSPKRSTKTIYELVDKAFDKQLSGHSSANESLGSSFIGSSLSDNSNIFDDEKKQQYEKITGQTSFKRNSSLKVNTNLTLGLSNIASSTSKPSSPNGRNSGFGNKRLKIVGTGTLNIEAHPYDHELVSMRLHTFTEVIDWNLDPHSMKPKKKDEYSCYLKALNVLSQANEILLIRIKNKDIMASLQTILLSLSYYYEAEQGQRDDDDIDSDLETDTDTASVQTVSLSKDKTLEEHKAEIDRAVFLIENIKNQQNIKTFDVAKFLLSKSCPLSVIKHAFDKSNVTMPDEVYELAGVANPKDSQINSVKLKKVKSVEARQSLKTKGVKKRSKTLRGGAASKRAAKASKMLGTGMHKAAQKIRRNSLDFAKRKRKPRPLYLQQSNSTDDWLPPDLELPTSENDRRYQEALFQHDNRFCTETTEKLGKSVMPSDRLDHVLRPCIDSMSQFSINGTKPISPFDDGFNAKIVPKVKDKKRSSMKKKFSMFGK